MKNLFLGLLFSCSSLSASEVVLQEWVKGAHSAAFEMMTFNGHTYLHLYTSSSYPSNYFMHDIDCVCFKQEAMEKAAKKEQKRMKKQEKKEKKKHK